MTDVITGTIFNIQRFSIHDGPSIRTTVFLKGCPLRCAWCHNPEGLSRRPVLSCIFEKCMLCRACGMACPQGAHSFTEDAHIIDRSVCAACGKCADVCSAGALELMGKEYAVDDVVKAALRDRAFYRDGGGVTLSGGEPLMQGRFAVAIARRLHEMGVSVCVETSGHAQPDVVEEIAPYVDIFLFDIKETDEARHRQYTGVGMELIRKNLRRIDDSGGRIIMRCPIVPGVNDRADHFIELAKLAATLGNLIEIDLEPYHPMGVSKNARIGAQAQYQNTAFMERTEIQRWQEYLSALTPIPVKIT